MHGNAQKLRPFNAASPNNATNNNASSNANKKANNHTNNNTNKNATINTNGNNEGNRNENNNGNSNSKSNGDSKSKNLGGPPHPVIVTITDNKDYTRVLLYSYYTTITGCGVLLSKNKYMQAILRSFLPWLPRGDFQNTLTFTVTTAIDQSSS